MMMLKHCSVRLSVGCRYAHFDVRTYKPIGIPPKQSPKTGVDLLNDPLFNKGTGFPYAERDRLDLRGLIPPVYSTPETQCKRLMQGFRKQPGAMMRFLFLQSLMDRNETLYYRLIMDNIKEMAPIVYTPTVGKACQHFGRNYRRPRGMHFSALDRGEMHSMVYNWPSSRVDVIVVTDGSRILGLGDLGAHGMGIPIGKLALYVACAGIHPSRVLPIMLDLGTDNEELLNDPLYLGVQKKRLQGQEYYEAVDEFMSAVFYRWPNVLVQFEDFRTDHALPLLKRYRDHFTTFNDDIQGTGAVATAGLMAAMLVQGNKVEDLCNQRIVCVGAGSAGIGICDAILASMERMGLPKDKAKKLFWIMDVDGLLTADRIDKLDDAQRFYARHDYKGDPSNLISVVNEVKPTVLLGVSGAAKAFSEDAIRAMSTHVSRPVIFPMSNPTDKAECTAEEAFVWSDGRAVVASGSPFSPVDYNGKTYHCSQANNMYIFPGVGLGVVASGAVKVTDSMFHAASLALVEAVRCLNKQDLLDGKCFPDLDNIREVSLRVACAVAEVAYNEGIASIPPPKDGNVKSFIADQMYVPKYAPIIPPGIPWHNTDPDNRRWQAEMHNMRVRHTQNH